MTLRSEIYNIATRTGTLPSGTALLGASGERMRLRDNIDKYSWGEISVQRSPPLTPLPRGKLTAGIKKKIDAATFEELKKMGEFKPFAGWPVSEIGKYYLERWRAHEAAEIVKNAALNTKTALNSKKGG